MIETPPSHPPEAFTPAPATMSLAARLMNVFAIPGDVFEEVKSAAHSTANWLVPTLLIASVIALTGIIVGAQPAVQQKVREQQEQMVEKQVKAGHMSRENADKQLAMMEKLSGPTMRAIASVAGGFIFGFTRLVWWTTALWLIARWVLKARFTYTKSMEVAGLAGMIAVLGSLVALLLQVNFSNPASSPSLALLVKDFDPKSANHLLLATVNVFDIWKVGVLGVALSRMTGAPFLRATFPVFAFWMICQFVLIAISVGFAQLMG